MNIRFVSSLTPEDENAIAPVLLNVVSSILSALPISYVIRIDTSDSQVFEHSAPQPGSPSLDGRTRIQGLSPARATL
jgi:hypothetical protein